MTIRGVDARPGTIVEFGPFEPPGLAPRKVRVHFPASFDRQTPRRALVLFDGQNVFDDAPSYSGGWHVHESLDRLGFRGDRQPLTIAVEHGGVARIDELAPWSDGAKGGRADALLTWITHDLLPSMRRELSLTPGPEGVVAGGSSMGGLAALYAHFRFPEAFGGAMCMSPSLWFARRRIFDFVAHTSPPLTSRIYLDCGAREAGGRMMPLVAEMAAHLTARGWPDDRLMWRPDARGAHNERAWRRRFPRAARFLFR